MEVNSALRYPYSIRLIKCYVQFLRTTNRIDPQGLHSFLQKMIMLNRNVVGILDLIGSVGFICFLTYLIYFNIIHYM